MWSELDWATNALTELALPPSIISGALAGLVYSRPVAVSILTSWVSVSCLAFALTVPSVVAVAWFTSWATVYNCPSSFTLIVVLS